MFGHVAGHMTGHVTGLMISCVFRHATGDVTVRVTTSGASLGALRWSPGPTNRPQGPTNNLLHNAIFRLIIIYKCQISQPNGAGPHQSIFPIDAPGPHTL